MKNYQSSQIRNVALVSHVGAGKTSLTEAMLFTSGAINRLGKVEAGTTTTDFDEDEYERQITINTALAPIEWKDVKINTLDTPGYFDFMGDVQGSLRVADAAVVLINAVSGVEVGTEKVWGYAEEHTLPRLLFVNKIDRENADFEKAVEQARQFFGKNIIPIQFPIGSEQNFKGVVDLLAMKAIYFEGDGKSVNEGDIPEDIISKVEELRDSLVETAAEVDDDLLMKYLEGESLNENEIKEGLYGGIKTGKIFPVLCGAATKNYGTQALLDMIVAALPNPLEDGEYKVTKSGGSEEANLPIDPKAPLAALVFKTLADPYVGRVNYFKIYSGCLKGDSQVYNSAKDKTERVGSIFLMRGKNQLQVDEIVAGDIGATSKLQVTATGDTLCDKTKPVLFPPISFPDPVISLAVEPRNKGDEEKVMAGLTRFLEEDPTFRIERVAETKQTLISGMGDIHLEIIVNRLAKKFNVEVDLSTPKVPYKETIRGSFKKEGKYKKQSGGRGQYGHVFLELQPLERGKEFEFENKIVGGVVPRQYIPAVEKGVVEAMQGGVVAGYPVVDIKVTLFDGSYHTVDSSEMAFKIAASMAFRQGMEEADPVLLEPIMDVEVIVPETFMGDIMGDLNARRGRIQGMEPGEGLQKIKAQAPMAEMFKYAIDLRSMTQGRGFFATKFSHYEEVPSQISEQIVKMAQAAKEK